MRVAKHGTRSMYTKYGCRCADCQEANRIYVRDYFRKRVMAAASEGPKGLHGRRSTYICGCRCEECRKAHRTYENAYRARIRALQRYERLKEFTP